MDTPEEPMDYVSGGLDYQRRARELRPLADALTLHVRGITDVHIGSIGGGEYAVIGTLGAWSLDASENGWSLTDDNGYSVAWDVWFGAEDADYQPLTLDPDTGALDPDECDAAAHAFASALTSGAFGIDPDGRMG